MNLMALREWLRSWWVTLRIGRKQRAVITQFASAPFDMDDFVDAERPAVPCSRCGNPAGYTETKSVTGIRYCARCGGDETLVEEAERTHPAAMAAARTAVAHPLILQKHRERHAEVGTTFHIRFEADVPFERMEQVMEEVATRLYFEDFDCFISAGRPT